MKEKNLLFSILLGTIIVIPLSSSGYPTIYRIPFFIVAGILVARILTTKGALSRKNQYILIFFFLIINVSIVFCSKYFIESKVIHSNTLQKPPENENLTGVWIEDSLNLKIEFQDNFEVYISDDKGENIEHELVYYHDKIEIEGYLDGDYHIELISITERIIRARNLVTKEKYIFKHQ